jgi:hypothetical protein
MASKSITDYYEEVYNDFINEHQYSESNEVYAQAALVFIYIMICWILLFAE